MREQKGATLTRGGFLGELSLPLIHLSGEVLVLAHRLVQILLYAVVLRHFVRGGWVEDVAQFCKIKEI